MANTSAGIFATTSNAGKHDGAFEKARKESSPAVAQRRRGAEVFLEITDQNKKPVSLFRKTGFVKFELERLSSEGFELGSFLTTLHDHESCNARSKEQGSRNL